jgi:tol-pal system protein YbgF
MAGSSATSEDLRQIRSDVNRLQRTVQRMQNLEVSGGATGGPTREHITQVEGRVTSLSKQIEALTASVASLNRRADELTARLDTQARQSIAPAPPPPRPVTALPPTPSVTGPSTGPPPPAPAPAPSPGVATVPPGPRPPATAPGPQDMYQAAYIDFSKGSYPLAITGFREFLRRYPDHTLAGNAQYWIGEAQLGLARSQTNAGQTDRAIPALEQAVQEFRKVVANYPRSAQAPAALYKEALTLIELKQPTVAEARLQYLVENFPHAAEASLARERLAALKDR